MIDNGTDTSLTAYRVGDTRGWTLKPAPWQREWMDKTHRGFAYRCLPMTIANQAGWILGCPVDFTAVWGGDNSPASVLLSPQHPQIQSHFGSGIVTFSIPYLFRTPKGIGLLVRGAPNYPKSNAFPLEGFVETDWSSATFTMNWKIDQPNTLTTFSKDEPICFLQPIDLRIIEQMQPVEKAAADDPGVQEAYDTWSRDRAAFNARPDRGTDWQRDYFVGRKPLESQRTPDHKTSVRVAPFQLCIWNRKLRVSGGVNATPADVSAVKTTVLSPEPLPVPKSR